MAGFDIPQQRLHNLGLATAPFDKPEDVVRWLGAVQSQDYGGAKWALGLRMRGVSDDLVEQAFNDGSILRTHVMRPTWHFVTPADIRWIVELTAPRVQKLNSYQYRQAELDVKLLNRGIDVLVRGLRGNNQRTREELREILEESGIVVGNGHRLAHIVMHAELEAAICSGPRRGKQFTYMLLDERAPQAVRMERDEALAELARRYFLSHGPATVHDFVWWSGLTVADARRGADMAGPQIAHATIGDSTYWFPESAEISESGSPEVYLLPNYDEYASYKDRSAVFDGAGQFVLNYIMVIDGQVAGTWKRTIGRREVVIETNTFKPLTGAQTRAVAAAAELHGEFLGLPVVMRN